MEIVSIARFNIGQEENTKKAKNVFKLVLIFSSVRPTKLLKLRPS
jgi:hypothetical protein